MCTLENIVFYYHLIYGTGVLKKRKDSSLSIVFWDNETPFTKSFEETSIGKHSLFEYWTGDKEKLLSIDDRELQNYVKYCSEILREYFGAVRKNMRKYWDDDTSKLLSVISLNGFIIALTRQLSVNGVQDFDFYDQVFSRWSFDFSSEKFPYTSSQYKKFSNEILENAFGIPKETLETI